MFSNKIAKWFFRILTGVFLSVTIITYLDLQLYRLETESLTISDSMTGVHESSVYIQTPSEEDAFITTVQQETAFTSVSSDYESDSTEASLYAEAADVSESLYAEADDDQGSLYAEVSDEKLEVPADTELTELHEKTEITEGAFYVTTEPAYDPYDQYSMMLDQKKARLFPSLKLVFLISSVLFLGSFILLCISDRRETCPEGIELNLAIPAAFTAFLVEKTTYYRSISGMFVVNIVGEVDFYGRIELFDVILSTVLCPVLIWSLLTFVSWCRKKSTVKFSLIYQITERLSASKDGFSYMILLPVLCLFIAISLGFFSFSEGWNLLLWLMLCETVVFIFVLNDRIRSIRQKKQQIIEDAKTSERMRVDLVANVSHDLRTPLTSIIGYGELLEKETLSEAGRNNLQKLNKKSRYLQEMVDAVFDLARVSSGMLKHKNDKLDLIRLLEQTIGDYEDMLQEKHFEVKRHYEMASLLIHSDGIFLHQIFSNLLTNAIKYTLSGTRIHLHVSSPLHESSSVHVSSSVPISNAADVIVIRMTNVANYEMKFSEEEILERFTRGDESRNSEGNGLGLAIVKTYTEALQGTFHVEVDGDQFAAVVTLPGNILVNEAR